MVERIVGRCRGDEADKNSWLSKKIYVYVYFLRNIMIEYLGGPCAAGMGLKEEDVDMGSTHPGNADVMLSK